MLYSCTALLSTVFTLAPHIYCQNLRYWVADSICMCLFLTAFSVLVTPHCAGRIQSHFEQSSRWVAPNAPWICFFKHLWLILIPSRQSKYLHLVWFMSIQMRLKSVTGGSKDVANNEHFFHVLVASRSLVGESFKLSGFEACELVETKLSSCPCCLLIHARLKHC